MWAENKILLSQPDCSPAWAESVHFIGWNTEFAQRRKIVPTYELQFRRKMS